MINSKKELPRSQSEWEQEVMKLKPGTKLDAKIMEARGYTAWEKKIGEFMYITIQAPDESEPYKQFRDWKILKKRYRRINFSEIDPHKHIITDIPPYSTSIEAAWEVWEHETPENWHMTVTKASGKYLALIIEVTREKRHRTVAQVEAKTAPEAMVKCRLLAKGVNGE